MIQFYLCRPYSSGWVPIAEIPFNSQGITEGKLAVDLNVAYQLNVNINPNLNSFYDILVNESDVGIIIKQLNDDGSTDFELGFIKDRQPQENWASGRTRIGLLSASYLLSLNKTRSSLIPMFSNYIGNASDFIYRISGDFDFRLIGSDQDLNFQTGFLNSFELLNQAIKSVYGWVWFDGGINPDTRKPIIYFGSTRDTQVQFKAVQQEFDDPFQTNIIRIIGDPKENLNGDFITHLHAIGVSSGGMGADLSSTIRLDDPQASYVNQQYPLVWLGETDVAGNRVYRIYDAEAYNTLRYMRLDDYSVEISPNSQNVDGAQQIDIERAKATVYRKAVNYLRNKSFGSSNSQDFSMPKIILPGTKIELSVQDKVETYNGLITTYEPSLIKYIKNFEYDLSKFV